MKGYLLTLGILLFAGVAAQPALADSFNLVGVNSGSGVPCSTSSPCAEVTITASGDTATFTVSSLDNGYVFDRFGFNFSGTGTLTLSGTPTGEVDGPSLGGSKQESSFGSFDYTFNTGENGGSNGHQCVVTGGTPGAGCTFSFTVTDTPSTTLTASEFESGFAGHIASSGPTGFAGDAVLIPTSPVPEPSSLALLGSGVLGLAGVVRRRFRC